MKPEIKATQTQAPVQPPFNEWTNYITQTLANDLRR